MTGPGYVWMILGWYHSTWYHNEDDTVRCSEDEMRQAAQSSQYISTESLQLSTSQHVTVANIVSCLFIKDIQKKKPLKILLFALIHDSFLKANLLLLNSS